MVLCLTHGARKGYIVCLHVMQGGTVAHFTEATDRPGPRGFGEALCTRCAALAEGIEPPLDQLRLVCSLCLQKIAVMVN